MGLEPLHPGREGSGREWREQRGWEGREGEGEEISIHGLKFVAPPLRMGCIEGPKS